MTKKRLADKQLWGVSLETVEALSARKKEPAWVRALRLEGLAWYEKLPTPVWGPDLSALDLSQIATYTDPEAARATDWTQVPPEIRDSFAKLGIPQAEERFLAGVGAQYDSEVVYHRVKEMVAASGVVYEDLEEAMTDQYAPLVREHFLRLLRPHEHKFMALHAALWSGGSFVYVPAGVRVTIPLQSYFRLNARGAGQFEHTLIIVDEGADLHFIEGCSAPRYNVASVHAGAVEIYVRAGARMRFSSVENWSKNMYNLNSKRARIEAGAQMTWLSASFGSGVTELYPATILAGRGATLNYQGVSFASKGQNLDTGCKVSHLAPETTSYVKSKSLSKNGGVTTWRSSVVIDKKARDAKSYTSCQSLLLDGTARADALPVVDVRCSEADAGHEASVGKISEQALFYLMARGLTREEARLLFVNGFVEEFVQALPLEYAVELNNLLRLEMETSE